MAAGTVERGDIWYVRLSDPDTGRDARKSEMGGDSTKDPVRPCVVVSSDRFNELSARITVVPFTHYRDGKEDTMARWAATVSCGRGYQPAIGSWGPEDPWNKSIVDVAQVWTVYCAPDDATEMIDLPSGRSYSLGQLNDVKWKEKTARLTEHGLVDVESALQVLISGCIRLSTPAGPADYAADRDELFRYQEGDVLNIDLPGWASQDCLVVSAAPIDYLRARIMGTNGYFSQVTVVPLIPQEEANRLAPGPLLGPASGVAPVSVRGTDDMLALCQEPYTIDWAARPPRSDPPRVLAPQLAVVREALRFYLGLPMCGYEQPQGAR